MNRFHDTAADGDWQPSKLASGVVDAGTDGVSGDQPIGVILSQLGRLDAEQVAKVLAHQQVHGGRFGEAAIALKLASTEDVVAALAQQFSYPYATPDRRKTSPELVTLNDPFSRQAEAFRAIRSQLIMRLAAPRQNAGAGDAASANTGSAKTQRALAIISPDSGDGKSFFAANLAVVLAQLGGRTLLVDADMRGPRQHLVFDLPNPAGLSGLLAGRADGHTLQRVPDVPSLYVLPVGPTPPNPLELVERPAFAHLLAELTTRFDHVIVDTPAHRYGFDGPVIASRCGAALIVARKHSSRIKALQELVGVFSGGAVHMAGVILNEYTG